MNQLAPTENAALALNGASSTGLVLSNDTMDKAFRMAELMASGKATVPKHLQGSVADCMAVTLQALQWNMSPFAVAQKTHLVGGTLGYEAQLVHAVLQSTGAIVGEFDYEYRGDGQALECRVGAQPRGKSSVKWGEWLSIKEVQTKNSPLWKTNPKQQIGYLQVKNWARAFKPGAILGVYTSDELAAPAEKHLGPADVVKETQVPTAYPADQFAEKLPQWRKSIEDGKTDAERLIAFITSRNPNTPLTDEQQKTLREFKKGGAVIDVQDKRETSAPPATAAGDRQPEQGAAPTYAQVADLIQKAESQDQLQALDEAIGQVADQQQRAELTAMAAKRSDDLPAF